MSEDRWARYAPLTGVVAVVLIIVGALMLNNYEYLKPPSEIISKLEDNALLIQVAAYFGLASSFFLVWFAGSVRTWLRAAEGDPGRLAAVAFGGGVAGSVCLLVGNSALAAAAARAGSQGGTTESSATALWDLNATLLGSALPIALAALVGAAAVVAFRTGVMQRWLAWGSAAVALGMLSPVNYIFVAIGMLWIGLISWSLFAGTRLTGDT
jgi:hypothetical protein